MLFHTTQRYLVGSDNTNRILWHLFSWDGTQVFPHMFLAYETVIAGGESSERLVKSFQRG